jgi:hypothetical protein
VQFLMETEGTDGCRRLFEQTPLKPFERDAGAPDRWMDVYGASLGALEQKWKAKLCELSIAG